MNDLSRKRTRRSVAFAAVGLAALLLPLFSDVAPAWGSMNLTLQDTPDLFSSFIAVHYAPAQDLLTANGRAQVLTDTTGTQYRIRNGSFALSALIDDLGQLQPSATESTVTISGTISALGYSGVLLQGDLVGFLFGDPGEAFGFLFQIDGGAAAALFGGVDSTAGIILHTRAFPGNFTTPFNNDGATSDTGTTPEPASCVVWPLLGLAGVLMVRRQRRRPWPT